MKPVNPVHSPISPRSSRKHTFVALALAAATGLAINAAGCIRSPAMKAVSQPRGGSAIQDGLCVVYSDAYQIRLGGKEKLHPFDINKYQHIYLQLVRDGLISPRDVHVPQPISRRDLLRVHSPEYLDNLTQPAMIARYLEFGPLAIVPAGFSDAAILQPFRAATGGTVLAARLALAHGIAINLGGGYHHAEPDRGGGFCIYADMPIAIRTLQDEGLIERALIVDLDVHQGNGTALCVAARDDVYTLDLHQRGIYPIPKEQNDRDVPLPAGMTDEAYMAVLREELPRAFEAASPDIVFYQSGVDGLAGDPLANFELTIEGMVARDEMVIAEAQRRGVPIVMVLGGGYSQDAWRAQYRSVRNLLEQYGGRTAAPIRGDRSKKAPGKP